MRTPWIETVEGKPTALYLWEEKNILPILKVDKGLADEANGVQLMQPIPDLDALLERAKANSVFGTKMRSVIKLANEEGIKSNVDQQFEIGKRIIDHGLVPIIEPEIDINSPEKAAAEAMLKDQIMNRLDALGENELVMLKLTLPETPNLYMDCINHPNCLKVVALSGGYSREVANQRLTQNNGMIASFSRALTEGLSAQQTDEAFTAMLSDSINSIVAASST